jgi:hypothetical protein
MSTTTNENEHGELLMATLRDMDKGGTFLRAADEELRQAVKLTQERGGKAVVTIRLALKLAKGKQMVVEPSVSATVPKPMTLGRIMYASEDGQLLLDDPDQMLLDLDAPKKVVPVPDMENSGYDAPRKVSVNN